MAESISKKNAILGIFWSAIEKFGIQGGQFIIGIVLARILMPEDFGLLAMIMVFMNVSQVFIESGLGKGLIQRKERNEVDFSTVFVYNIISAVVLYLVIYLLSPYVANFYSLPKLSGVLRILGLNLMLISIGIVPLTRLTIDLNFKLIAIVNFVSMLISGGVGIICAYYGLGVWSLVIQLCLRSFIALLLFWSIYKWKISFVFSISSFKGLFNYGSKLLIASVYSHILLNLYNILIGKAYSSYDLGCYSRAKGFTDVTSDTLSSIVHQVTFPILSGFQNEKDKFFLFFRKSLSLTGFVIIPAMILLSILADPIVRVLLNDKWLFVIPLLKWMAFTRVFYPLSSLNLSVLNSIGRTDLYLKLELIKFPIVIVPMLISFSISVKAMIIAQVIASVTSFFVNAHFTKKFYKYGAFEQLKDLSPIIFASIIMAIVVVFSLSFSSIPLFQIIIGLFFGGIIYLGVSYLLKISSLYDIVDFIRVIKRH